MAKRDLSALVAAKNKKEQQDGMLAKQQDGMPADLRKKTFRLSRSVAIRLGVLAKEQETSEQQLVERALLLLFKEMERS